MVSVIILVIQSSWNVKREEKAYGEECYWEVV